MANWAKHRDTYSNRLPILGPGPSVLVSNPSGSVVVSRSKFDAFEGEGNAMPYAVIGMCLAGGGQTQKVGDGINLNDVWKPGRVGLALPGPANKGFTPPMEALAIAFDLNEVPACHGRKLVTEDLFEVANQLYDDKLVSAVMIALLHDAEAHGASSAFFDHGLSLMLHRLVTRSTKNTRQPLANGLNQSQLSNVFEIIEARLEDDLRVKELAELAGLSPRTFTRTFKRETGYTPFMYLTKRRMERAKILLKSDSSVTDTAAAVGYGNPAKFASAFKRWVGTTPSSWKNDH